MGSRGAWEEYDAEQVKTVIRDLAKNPDLTDARTAEKKARETFDPAKGEITSILENELQDRPDRFLDKLRSDLNDLAPMSKFEVAEAWRPKGQLITRDTTAAGQGSQIPPHFDVLADVVSIRHSFGVCHEAAEICRKAASHLERKARRRKSADRVGTNVFIGHGHSLVWRELKDFVEDRLSLPVDEFNRVPIAGVTNVARLSEMLDSAAIAFLVMTAEDETAGGALQARMNVIHEAGLFQGRLGFSRAIILIEEGCEEFSNVEGLGKLKFPPGKISAAFEDVRQVLEREGLIDAV